MSAAAGVKSIIKRNGEFAPFDLKKISTAIYKAAASVGIHDMPQAEKLAGEVLQNLERSGGTPSVEEVQDLVEEVLIEHSQAQIAKAYIIYREDRARLRRARIRGRERSELVPYKTMWRTLVWNLDHDAHTLEGLNRHIRDGTFPSLVREAEELYEENIRSAAQSILMERERIRVVIVAGPSSSGKTTTTARVSEILHEQGLEVVPLNLDNYFFDLHLHPQDERGDYDFETPEALDLKLINLHLEQLLAGEEVQMPIYDFKQGRRLAERTPMRIRPGQVLLLDTLHGLFDPLTESIDEALKFRLYIETVLQLRDASGRWVRWTDLRLLRRALRDAMHRGYDPERTISHWHYVRRGELKHIIPHLSRADFVVNGALPYELPIFKSHLERHFVEFIQEHEHDPSFTDGVGRARRVKTLLEQLEPMNDSDVPATSVLREFIGGSAYKLH